MTDGFISSLYIQKLGHELEEIRSRSLNYIISKLGNGTPCKNELPKYLDLLKKLFEWFDFPKFKEEEKVLNLMFKIFNSKMGVFIVRHVGTSAIMNDFKEIRKKIKVRYHILLDKSINMIATIQENPNIVPPLVGSLPLSYRSTQSCFTPDYHTTSAKQITTTNRERPDSLFTTNRDTYFSDRIETTATPITGIERKSPSISGIQTGIPQTQNIQRLNCISSRPISDHIYEAVPIRTLNWQSLIESDYHVLKSVEKSLSDESQPTTLLNSLEFFYDVMLQDFPAEVFIQRPAVLMIFYEMILNCKSTRITNAALTNLSKLTENLITRARFYSDPATHNTKPETTTLEETDSNAKPPKIFKYNFEMKEYADSDSERNGLNTNEMTLPEYCVQSFICILTYISKKPLSFREGVNKKKTRCGINKSLQIIDKLVLLTTICIKSNIWSWENNDSINEITRQLLSVFEKLGEVLEQYRLMVVATDMEYFERMTQLYLLISTSYLLSDLVPVSKSNSILPRSLKHSLSRSLLDASFGRLFPAAHESLIQYVNVFSGYDETEFFTKYKDVQNVCVAMTKAIKILKYHSTQRASDSLQFIYDSLPCLEFHKNMSIINTFLKICLKNNALFNSNEETFKLVGDILLCLLSSSDEDIKVETYSMCQKLIVSILGLNHSKHLNETEPGAQIAFFLQSDIIIEIAAHGLSSESIQVQTYSEDILIHLLKCKFIVSESVWLRLIKAIMPSMPILQCAMSNTTPLGKAIVKILDPDVSPSLFISRIDILKGNLRMLFSKDIKLREEAVSRLCWLLTTEENANEKIPKIKSLHDYGLSNVFQIGHPIDMSRLKSSHHFYKGSSLQQVIELLSSKNVEPAIRRSALTQISVMLEDQFLHPLFLEQNGLTMILDILRFSLHEHEYYNFPDSVISIISILKSICLHNTVIRQELSLNIQLLFDFLRVLFLHCTDKKIQQDGALLSCLLLFSEFTIYNHSVKDIVFSLPDIVVKKLNIPFTCHTHWKNSKHSKPNLLSLLISDNWCKSTLRMHWNIEWFSGVCELVKWSQAPDISALTSEQLTEFSTDLRLTKDDLSSLKASSIKYSCQKYLYEVNNAVTHQSVLEGTQGIAGYITLWQLVNKKNLYDTDLSIIHLNWEESFTKFLSAPPGNHADQMLLVEILRMFTIMLKLYKRSGRSCWITEFIQDSSNYLPKLLQIDMKRNYQLVSIELLQLIAECCTLDQHILDIDNHKETKKKPLNMNWIHVIQNITENLKFNDSDEFYNLAYLDKVLLCLVRITSNLGWTNVLSHSTDFNKLILEIIEALFELLMTFHYGKGSEAASSFMGLNITRNALLTVNHILCEMQFTFKKNWEVYWLSDAVFNSTLFSLSSLWSCRDVVVRAATLQLLSGLASCPRGASVIVETVRQKAGGIWESALLILLDHNEASIVREYAAVLLMNLCSHVNISGNSQVSLPLCHAPLSAKKTTPMETVQLLLNNYNFYQELEVMLACLYLSSAVQQNAQSDAKNRFTEKTTDCTSARSFISGSSKSNTIADSSGKVYVTPGLVKATANFVSNLLYLAPESITETLAEYDLIKTFFRCLTIPSTDISDSRKFLLYSDTLEMCCSICALLTRSILVNINCNEMILNTRECLHILITLLNPSLYHTKQPQFFYLRNQLWCEIFRFITALLEINEMDDNFESARETFNIISNIIAECGHDSFHKALSESIESSSLGLQKSALQALTSFLTLKTLTSSKPDKMITLFSAQNEFDSNQSAHDLCVENQENTNPNSELYLTNSRTAFEQNMMINQIPKLTSYRSENSIDRNLMFGSDLCKILLRLYQMQNLEKNKDRKRRATILGALSSLLYISEEAKMCALNEGLLDIVVEQLKALHLELNLHSAESLRRITEKKKVCPILKEVEDLFGLLTNFLNNFESAKDGITELDLADLVHKFWLWFQFDRQMFTNTLKLLCTFTGGCDSACHSLILTNPAPGSGPRKVANSVSLLNVVIDLVGKEMDLVSRSHDITVLQLSFHLLQNVCSVFECRNVISKSNLLQFLSRLHPALTKRQRPWDTVESLWLDFLQTYTFFVEGQLQITKTNDSLELLITMSSNSKSANRISALSVLRNVAFHYANRIRLLASVEFLQLLHSKIVSGNFNETNIAVSIIWALVANSQRSKITIKCAGLDTRIHEIIRQYEMKGISNQSYQVMLYVLAVLKDGEK